MVKKNFFANFYKSEKAKEYYRNAKLFEEKDFNKEVDEVEIPKEIFKETAKAINDNAYKE